MVVEPHRAHRAHSTVVGDAVNGARPEDIECITCNEHLRNFIDVTCGAYKPIMIQVQLNRADRSTQTPPPDGHRYFWNNAFPPTVLEDPYDPVASDSAN